MERVTQRESRMWWIDSEGYVFHTEGFSCAPDNPEYWWVPKLGFSTSSVHETEADAKKAAAKWLRKEIAGLQAQLSEVTE
jgi:hypothetical protein